MSSTTTTGGASGGSGESATVPVTTGVARSASGVISTPPPTQPSAQTPPAAALGPAAAPGSSPATRAAAGAPPAAPTSRTGGPRRVKLTVSRVDPWSAMKMSFLLSVAVGIAGVVLMSVLWLVLSGMGVFADVNRVVASVLGSTTNRFDLMDYIGFDRVVSLSIVIGVVDIILLTAISTLAAFLYNICSSLVGGLQVTLTDD